MRLLSPLTLSLLLLPPCGGAGECVFTQACASGAGCHPTSSTFAPAPATFAPSAAACPQYSSSTCCNSFQNDALKTNFFLLEVGFGPSLGGNNACVANVEALWCAFSCSPDQGRFVAPAGYANMTDPINPKNIVEVLRTVLTVDATWACGIWESCRLTFTSELASFTTCEQFLEYQVAEAVSKGSYTTFAYAPRDAPRAAALSAPLFDCCSYPAALDTPGAAGNVTAPCAYCGGSCGDGSCYTGVMPAGGAGAANATPAGDVTAHDDSPFTGFQVVPLAVEWSLLLAGSLLVLGTRAWGGGDEAARARAAGKMRAG